MSKVAVMAALLTLVSVGAVAEVKPCDELKAEIAAKLDAKGVQNYQLEIVASDAAAGQKVVGSCEGGTKSITYTRSAAAASSKPAAGEAKPTN